MANDQYDSPEYQYVDDWVKELMRRPPETELAIRLRKTRRHVARTLGRVRLAARATQAEVTEKSDLKQSMVARLENVKDPSNPTIESLVKYLDAFDAELIIGAVKDERVFTFGEPGGRVVVLSAEDAQRADDRGLTPKQYVLLCIARSEAADAAARELGPDA